MLVVQNNYEWLFKVSNSIYNTSMEKINYKTILKKTEYMKMILANLINRFGDSLDAIALTWLIFELSNSPALTAINFGINFIPTIILQPIAGAFVEQKNKKQIMVLCDIARGLIVSFIAVATIMEILKSWMLICCTVLISSFEAFRVPCGSAILPLLLTEEEYSYGMSLSSTGSFVSELIGTALAGFIIGLLGIGGAIFIDGITFFLSSLIIFFTKIPHVDSCEIQSTKDNFKEGIHYLIHHKTILILCLIACYLNAVLVPFNSFQSVLAKDIYQLDSKVLSVMGISLTIGMGLGSYSYPMLAEKISLTTSILISNVMIGVFYFGCIIASNFTSSLIFFYLFLLSLCLLFGLSIALMSTALSVHLMKKIDKNYLSRIMGISSALSVGAMPVISFIISAASVYFSVSHIFIGFGIISISLTLVLKKVIPR